MKRFIIYILCIGTVLTAGMVWAGTVTLVTYYPAPTGNYQSLTADRIVLTSTTTVPTCNNGTIYNHGGQIRFCTGGAFVNLSSPWTVSGTDTYLTTLTNNLAIGSTASSGYKLNVAGDIQAVGFYYSSDERLKDNIKPIENALEKIKKINGVTFTWKKDDKADLGVVAQNVETVVPELVMADKEGMKSVKYGNITALLIEAVKAQQVEIEELKKKISVLEQK
jgi:hypothetical protein